MSIFRSEEMKLYSILISKDSLEESINLIGEINCLHFLDLNYHEQIFNRNFSKMIQKCEEVEKRIFFIEEEAKRFGLQIYPPEDTKCLNQWIEDIKFQKKTDNTALLDLIYEELISSENFLTEQIKKFREVFEITTRLCEKKDALYKAASLLSSRERQQKKEISFTAPIFEPFLSDSITGLKFFYIIGIMNKEDIQYFKRLIFRTSRGNALVLFNDLENPTITYEGKIVQKIVFVILFKESEQLKIKFKRICENIGNEIIEMTGANMNEKEEELKNQIKESKLILNSTKMEIKSKLKQMTEIIDCHTGSLISNYSLFVKKQKFIYTTLNMFKQENNSYSGLYWAPGIDEKIILEKINQLQGQKNMIIPKIEEIKSDKHHLVPPTYIRTNEFLKPFQEIVNTYGIPNYQESNPALFSIITFPFLFGVMFGDVAHGLVLFCISAYVCLMKNHIERNKSPLMALIDPRYLLLLMGFFAAFCGFIYNDFASVPLNIWNSCYINDLKNNIAYRRNPNCVYPFGFDPKWYVSNNELLFFNSFKMKISVILGVLQMLVGVAFKGFNAIHFGSTIDFLYEFVPQLIFLAGIFGYMDLMIVIKWLTDWDNRTSRAPYLINVLTKLGLSFGDVTAQPLWGAGPSHTFVNRILLVFCLLCIPWMLIIKPLKLKTKFLEEEKHEEEKRNIQMIEFKKSDFLEDHNAKDKFPQKMKAKSGIEEFLNRAEKEHNDFVEILIHQIIETIEFVLGAISNTASYLRLWALSLAHAQLSKVFFQATVGRILLNSNPNFILIYITYVALSFVTFGILLCMDALECFLHALRLHWVEFQSKFYKGNGYKFTPFNLNKIGAL